MPPKQAKAAAANKGSKEQNAQQDAPGPRVKLCTSTIEDQLLIVLQRRAAAKDSWGQSTGSHSGASQASRRGGGGRSTSATATSSVSMWSAVALGSAATTEEGDAAPVTGQGKKRARDDNPVEDGPSSPYGNGQHPAGGTEDLGSWEESLKLYGKLRSYADRSRRESKKGASPATTPRDGAAPAARLSEEEAIFDEELRLLELREMLRLGKRKEELEAKIRRMTGGQKSSSGGGDGAKQRSAESTAEGKPVGLDGLVSVFAKHAAALAKQEQEAAEKKDAKATSASGVETKGRGLASTKTDEAVGSDKKSTSKDAGPPAGALGVPGAPALEAIEKSMFNVVRDVPDVWEVLFDIDAN